jgi:trehalose/maltose transport system permease protein
MGQPTVTQVETPTIVASKRRTTALQTKQARLAWLMLLPTIVGIIIVALYPLGRTFYDSLTDASFGAATTHFIGLKNYQRLFQDPQWWPSVYETLKFTLITVVFEFVLGMIVALVVNSNFPGRGTMRAAMLVPWAIITVVNAQMWKLMYNDTYGVFNDILERVGIIKSGIAWTALPNTSLGAVSAIDIWKTTPFVALLLLAGMQLIPGDVYEAAAADGANKWQQFWRITLPLLRPAILVTLIFRTMDALRVFDVFYVFFGNRPDTMTMAVYDQENIVSFGSVGYGAAISVGIFVILAIVIAVYVSILRIETS